MRNRETDGERIGCSVVPVSFDFIGIICVEWDFKEIDIADSGYYAEACSQSQL